MSQNQKKSDVPRRRAWMLTAGIALVVVGVTLIALRPWLRSEMAYLDENPFVFSFAYVFAVSGASLIVTARMRSSEPGRQDRTPSDTRDDPRAE
jgi:uncharacterized membrane protein HdeD (DUF308 family)